MQSQMYADGIKRTQRALDELETRVRKKVLRKSVRAGGAVILKVERKHVPRMTGLLKRSLAQKVKSYKSGNVIAIVGQKKGAKITARKKLRKGTGGISGRGDVVPIHLVDQPIQPHEITPTNARAMRIGQDQFVGRVRHPGHRGRRFMWRAAGESRGPAISAFRTKTELEVNREASAVGARHVRRI